MFTFRNAVLVAVAAIAAAACSRSPDPAATADTLYVGGDIVTVNDAQPTAEALAVKDGRILAVGARADLEKAHKAETTKVVDLAGKTMLPGFIDPHSHYSQSLSIANQVNVFPPPAGPGKDVDSIIAELVKFRDARSIPAGTLIQAYGYDDTVMPDGRLLNRDDLDQALPDHPVMVGHVSMHGAVLNSAAMKQWNLSATTRTPPGGIIVRKPGTQEPYGLIMETAYLPIFASLPAPTADQEVAWSKAGQLMYAAAGITTAHDGATHASDLALMQRAAAAGANVIDIIAYPFITDLDEILEAAPVETWGRYDRHLKIGGAKITSDGSAQGRTAYYTAPYLTGGPGGEKDWRGEPTFPEEMLREMVKKVYGLGVPLNYHANGDAAIDMLLRAHEWAAADDPGKDRNVTIIHAQFTRKDQLDKYVEYSMRPSFFTVHTYYFADAHIVNRGLEQASYISPMRDAIDKGLHPTNHTDFVVAPLDQMFVLWSAVNRNLRSGGVIGADQRVTPLEALKAQTIWAAEQYDEQATKGTLEAGKLADLVILDGNPLTVEPAAIRDIKVVETLKEGRTIWPSP